MSRASDWAGSAPNKIAPKLIANFRIATNCGNAVQTRISAPECNKAPILIFNGILTPGTAASLGGLAGVLERQGDLAGARPLCERALAIREKVLGAEHPDTATSLSNLARLLGKSGHTDDAEAMFKRAITIGEKAPASFSTQGAPPLGLGHPLTQRYCSHCARLFLDTGRATEALSLGQATLATRETASGPNHPWTKDSARVTADALDAQGRMDKAAELRARHGIGGP